MSNLMRRTGSDHSNFRYIVTLLVIAGLYFFSGKLGLSLAFIQTNASAVWLCTGLALTAYLLFGYYIWPAIFIGAFFVNLTTAGSVATSIGIAAGNTLEGLTGAYLVNRFAGGRYVFDKPHNIFKFVFLAGIVSTSISATLGVISLFLGRLISRDQFGAVWWTWWMGDMVSNFIVAPMLLIWSNKPERFPRFERLLESVVLVLVVFLVSVAVFGGWVEPFKGYPLSFVCLPFILWSAFRFGLRGAITTVFVISAVAVWGTLHGFGPFAMQNPNDSLLLLQAFMGIVTITNLILASVVAENKKSAQDLYDLNARKSAILEASLDCIVSMDSEGRIVDFNSAAERTFGYTYPQVVGKELAEVIIPLSLRKLHRQGLRRYLKTGETKVIGKRSEFMAMRSDGSEFPVEMAINVVRLGRKPMFTGYLRDITDRKKDEEDRARLATIVECTDDAIIAKTLDGIIMNWNKGAERLYGYTAEEIVGRPVSVLVPPDRIDELSEMFERLRRGESIDHYETMRIRKDRKTIYVSVTISPIKNSVGQLYGVSSIARDITARKLAEDALIIANKRLEELVELKDEFVASVSHELRTPLTAIKEGISLLADQVVGPINDEQKDFLKTIEDSVERLTELINNLLSLSKIEAGKFRLSRQCVNLSQVVETLISNYKTIAGRRIVRANIDGVPDVFADQDRLLQILGNLFSNAVKFTRDDGTITISAQNQSGSVAISVEDDGIGIANEDLPKLFHKFSQVGKKKSQGTGLGLAIVKQLVEMHQGSIFVASTLGKGSRFTFTLPVYVPHLSVENPFSGDLNMSARRNTNG